MSKSWTFATPLLRGHGRILADGVPVESFGLWETQATPHLHEARAEQLCVHYHRFGSDDEPSDHPSEEFLVELMTEDREDRIFVSKLPPQPTLAASVQWALARIRDDGPSAPGARLGVEERLEVPCIDFDLARRYAELEGAGVVCAPLEAQAFGDVLERVRFRLDEGGALLVSEARVGGLCLPPRSLVCYPPFLVMLVRRGSPVPFLALWIETPALLTPRTTGAPRGA